MIGKLVVTGLAVVVLGFVVGLVALGSGAASLAAAAVPGTTVCATTGPISVLDEGADIGPTSLSLTGHTLTWWRGGIEKSAALP